MGNKLPYASVFVNMYNRIVHLCFVYSPEKRNVIVTIVDEVKKLAIALNVNLYLSKLSSDIQSMQMTYSLYIYFLFWEVSSCLE